MGCGLSYEQKELEQNMLKTKMQIEKFDEQFEIKRKRLNMLETQLDEYKQMVVEEENKTRSKIQEYIILKNGIDEKMNQFQPDFKRLVIFDTVIDSLIKVSRNNQDEIDQQKMTQNYKELINDDKMQDLIVQHHALLDQFPKYVEKLNNNRDIKRNIVRYINIPTEDVLSRKNQMIQSFKDNNQTGRREACFNMITEDILHYDFVVENEWNVKIFLVVGGLEEEIQHVVMTKYVQFQYSFFNQFRQKGKLIFVGMCVQRDGGNYLYHYF